MKTYIFSNCKKSDEETYAKNLFKAIDPSDRLVVLNRGNVFFGVLTDNKEEFKKYTNMHTIHRAYDAYGVIGYFGLYDSWRLRRFFQSITTYHPYWNPDHDLAHVVTGTKGSDDPNDRELTLPWMRDYFKATGKTPTTGYSAYYLSQQLYGCEEKDIILVNFYGNEDNSTSKVDDHAWAYENDWLKGKNRIFL